MKRALSALGVTACILGIAAAVTKSKFSAALKIERERVRRGSRILSSPFGEIEFALAGDGEPLLISHGAGGGFDQALFGAGRLLAAGYQVVAPSRFGYLRSSSPDDPSPENQADAFAFLLDELHVQNVPVVGISAGAPSALQFAVRHPDRCRSLVVMVPAASVAGDPQGPMPSQGPLQKAIIERVVKSDFLFWLGINLAPRSMVRSVLATDAAVVAAASAEERRRAYEILWNVMPISEREEGLRHDAWMASTPQSMRLDQIKAPTLVISLEDDFYRTIGAARFIAAQIPGARLLTYASGGHIWVGHDAELFVEVEEFLKQPTEKLA
ncbi:MAG TPA: alpha/beta hydrolase [Candidatus Angelobacter sp.]